MSKPPSIIYTLTDEAPALATHSLLPIVRAFAKAAAVPVELRDISLAGRILAAFADRLRPAQRVPDALAELGGLAKTPAANIIKLPNISASIPQMLECIAELQKQGYDLPDYPADPADAAAREIRSRYDRVKGSAVNPVLREGNSDRRAPKAVKDYARAHPQRMAAWAPTSKTHVATMGRGDFRANETSITLPRAAKARIEHVAAGGKVTVMKDDLALEAGEVLDATCLSRAALVTFLEQQVADAVQQDVLFSIHLKATMMKVSDPIVFGHCVRVYFADLFAKHGAQLAALGVDADNGIGDLLVKAAALPADQQAAIRAAIRAACERGPGLAMVNSEQGITNLHVPSDVIIDASMPPMIRDGGRMWNAAGKLQDCKAVIPDSSYAGVYQAVIEDCQAHGAYDPATMGSVSNVGLMAQKAEEYGSHDKTFEMSAAGTMRIVDQTGAVLLEHRVQPGDVWRACQVKDGPIRDWVKLAVTRARASGAPAVFWLDPDRAHDVQLIAKVETCLAQHDTDGLDIRILAPAAACKFSVERIRRGEDTISVTGNVLRDYLTDLFPILEVGTSAKMLSIVPLMNGGGLFETGAGGSAPKHVEQFVAEGHLRWDSLGEFLALAVSFEHLADAFGHPGARVLATTLDAATAELLENDESPQKDVHLLDSRGSHFHLARHWARAVAEQTADPELAARFRPVAAALTAAADQILAELDAAQGSSQELGGYYRPDPARVTAAMRPSKTLNAIIDGI